MFDRGMKIHEVMAVSGHKTASQLFRYVQIKSILKQTLNMSFHVMNWHTVCTSQPRLSNIVISSY